MPCSSLPPIACACPGFRFAQPGLSRRRNPGPIFGQATAPGFAVGSTRATMLFRMRDQRIAEPRAVLVGLHARAQPVAVARPVTLEHVVELAPVDRAEIVMA